MDFDKIIYYSATPIFSILLIFLVIVLVKTIKNNKNK